VTRLSLRYNNDLNKYQFKLLFYYVLKPQKRLNSDIWPLVSNLNMVLDWYFIVLFNRQFEKKTTDSLYYYIARQQKCDMLTIYSMTSRIIVTKTTC